MRREEMRLPCQCEQIHRQLVKRKAALPRTCPERPYPRAQALPLPVRVFSCVCLRPLSLSLFLRCVHRKKGKNKLGEGGNKGGQKNKIKVAFPFFFFSLSLFFLLLCFFFFKSPFSFMSFNYGSQNC